MKLKEIGIIATVLLLVFLFGWFAGRYDGRNSVKTTITTPFEGVVTVGILEKGMSETKPDTIYVPYLVYIETEGHDRQVSASIENKKVPIETIESDTIRDEAINTALVDWNTKRSYSGVFFDSETSGAFSYAFDVQFNRAGEIQYRFEPAPILIPERRIRLRPTIGGEYYTNGQYSFGGGVQYGAFGLNVRALSLSGGKGYAFGVGAQFLF
jgi:hypothetical protein